MKPKKSNQQQDMLFAQLQEIDADNTSISVRLRLQQFYICEMHKILKSYKRRFILSYVLLIFYYSQIVGNTFSPEVLEELKESSPSSASSIKFINSLLNHFKIYPIFSDIISYDDSSKQAIFLFLILAFCLNFLLILYICYRLIHYVFWGYFTMQMNEDFTEKLAKKARSNTKMQTFCDYFASFFFRTYLYIFAIPFIQSSFKIGFMEYSQKANENDYENKNVYIFMSFLVFISTFFILILTQKNEYDYSIQMNDYLAQHKSYIVYVYIVTDIIGSGMYLSGSIISVKVFSSLNCIIRLIICLYQRPFISEHILKFVTQICFLYFIVYIIAVIIPMQEHSNIQLLSFSILIFCSIPLSFKISQVLLDITNFDGDYTLPYLEKDIKKITPQNFSKHIRSLIKLFSIPYEDYIKNGLGIQFETIFSNHIDQCQSESNISEINKRNQSIKGENLCFCNQYIDCFKRKKLLASSSNQQAVYTQEDINQAVSNIIGEDYRRFFLVKYTNYLIQKFFDSSNKNNQDKLLEIKPTYMYFLLQIAKSPAKAFQQIYQLKLQMKKSSIQLQALLQEIIDEVNLSFSQFVHSNTFQNQRLSISSVYEFDYLYKDFLVSLKSAIQSRQRYYEFLSSDYINLNELLKESMNCLGSKRVVEDKIRQLFDVNPHSTKLLNIADIYIEFFDFKKRRVRHFIQKSRQIMNRHLQRGDQKIDLFDPTTCSVFLSLHNKQIMKVSSSTGQFFKCQSEDLIGKSFSLLLPDFMIPSFNKYIDQLLEEVNMDLIKIGEYFTFFNQPKTKNVIPIYLRTKLDIIQNNEFGLSFQIQQGRSCKVSVVTDSDYNVISCTQEFQNLILNYFENTSTSKIQKSGFEIIKNCNIKNYIPLIFSFNEITQDINSFEGYNEKFGFRDFKIQNYKVHKSLLILPINNEAIKKLNIYVGDNHKEVNNYFNNFSSNEFEFLEITFTPFTYKQYTETNSQINILDIYSYKKIRSHQEVNDLFLKLKEALTSRFQQEINIPMFFTQSSPLEDRRSPSLTYVGSNKKGSVSRLYQSRKSENQLSDIILLSCRSKQGSYQNLDKIEETYIEDAIENSNAIGDINNLGSETFCQFKETIPRKKQSEYLDSPQLGYSIENILEQQVKLNPYSNNKGQRDSKSTKFEDSLVGTSRISFLSPKYTHELSVPLVSIAQDNEYLKGLMPYPPNSPTITSANYIMNQQEKFTPTKKDADNNSENQKSFLKYESINVQDSYNMLGSSTSQIDISTYRHKGRFVSSKLIVQNGTSTNLLGRTERQLEKENITEKDSSQSSEDNSKVKEDYDGVIQLSNKQPYAKRGRHKDESESTFKERQQQKHLDEQQSIRSCSSQIFSKKQSLFEMVVSRRDPKQIQISKLIGLLAFFILISISCLLFFKVQLNFKEEWISYSNLTVGPGLLEGFTQVLRIKELLTMIDQGKELKYLMLNYTLPEQALIYKEGLGKLNQITTEIGEFQQETIHQGFSDFMLNNLTALYSSNVQTSERMLTNYTRMYSLINLPLQLRQYLTMQNKLSRIFTYMNYNSFISTISTIQDISTEKAQQTLSDTKYILDLSIIIVQVVSILTVIIVFPIYSIIQQKRQEILNLLVTFDPNFLQQIIEKYKNALSSKQIQGSTSNFNNYDRLTTKQTKPSTFQQVSILDFAKGNRPVLRSKKRQISHTNSLPKFSLKLSFMTFLIFIIISLYCLLNYLLTKDFFEYFGKNIDELSLVAQSKSFLGLNYCGLYLLSNSYLYGFDKYSIGLMISFFEKTLIPNNQQRVDELYQIDNNFILDRPNMDEYKEYLLKVIKEDACGILETDYGKTLIGQVPLVDPKECRNVFKGALSKGLIFTFKEVFSKISTLYQNYLTSNSNPKVFFALLNRWDKDNNLKEFDKVYYFLRAIFDSQSEFLIQQSQKQFDYLMNISQALYIYNLIMVSIVFLFVWRKFLKIMCDQIQETTFLLSLIPIEQLLENPYIVSYMNKMKRSIKKDI